MHSAFKTVQDFFHMGGYGLYVWSAYVCLMIILVMNLYIPLRRFYKIKQKLFRTDVKHEQYMQDVVVE